MAEEFVLSSQGIGWLAEAISDGNTWTEMHSLFLKSEVDSWTPPSQAPNKLNQALKVLEALRTDNTEASITGALELARTMLAKGKADPTRFGRTSPARWWEPLRAALAADGYEFDETNDQLVPTVPSMQVTKEVSWIERELDARGWTVARGHYRQAVDAFADGNWASANAQLRAFFEALIRLAAGMPASGGMGQVQAAFNNLEAAGKLVEGESEFGKKLWGMLHAAGTHPGLSDEDESRFRLLTLTGYSRYLLNRV